MTIDIFSLIFGAMLWEFVRGYFTGFVMPSIRQRKARKQKRSETETKPCKKQNETKEAES